MNPSLSNLPETLQQAFAEISEKAQTLGIDPSQLLALMMLPLTSEHFSDAEARVGQRLDSLRQALRANSVGLMRLLSQVSLSWFLECLARYRASATPCQKTRTRLVLCGDDSLLVHAEESHQRGVTTLFSTLYKRCRKAHDLVLLGVTVGAKRGSFFFPLWVELWHQPGQRTQTRPQRMAAALARLDGLVRQAGHTLEGIDFAAHSAYRSPVVEKAVDAAGLVMTTQLKSNRNVTLLTGEDITPRELLQRCIQTEPIRHDTRAGNQAYYWTKQVFHPSAGKGTLVIQRRLLRSGRFMYHYHFSQHQQAKAITILQIAKRRWPVEVFFRDTKQHLGLGHLAYRRWSSFIGHIALRSLVYFVLVQARRFWRWPRKRKTLGAIKRGFQAAFESILQESLASESTP